VHTLQLRLSDSIGEDKRGKNKGLLPCRYMMGLVVVMGLFITAIYAYTNKVLLKDPNVKLPSGGKKKVRQNDRSAVAGHEVKRAN
jgi:phosphotransferase system  glucose/maltose/N-acetylglucosamine-specific IIC component